MNTSCKTVTPILLACLLWCQASLAQPLLPSAYPDLPGVWLEAEAGVGDGKVETRGGSFSGQRDVGFFFAGHQRLWTFEVADDMPNAGFYVRYRQGRTDGAEAELYLGPATAAGANEDGVRPLGRLPLPGTGNWDAIGWARLELGRVPAGQYRLFLRQVQNDLAFDLLALAPWQGEEWAPPKVRDGRLVGTAAPALLADACPQLPGHWMEAEDGLGDGKVEATGKNDSGGHGVGFFGPGQQRFWTFETLHPVTNAVFYLRYRQGRKEAAAAEVLLGPAEAQRPDDPRVRSLGRLTLPGTGSWEKRGWTSLRLDGDLASGHHRLFVLGKQGDFAFDMVGIAPFRRDDWVPPDMVDGGLAVGIKALAYLDRGTDKARNLLIRDEAQRATPAELTVEIANLYPEEPVNGRLEIEAVDHQDKVLVLPPVHYDLKRGERTVRQQLTLPPCDYGWYALRGKRTDATGAQAVDLGAFCVVRPPREGLRPDSMFGLNFGRKPEDLDAAKQLGVKWRRGLERDLTYPGRVRPAPDKWWTDKDKQGALDDLRRVRDQGILSLGYVDYNMPWNVALRPDGKRMQPHRHPPLDMKLHAEMVAELIRTFGSEVPNWELWNEPGGYFWGGTDAQYRQMLKTVWETVKPTQPEINLISGGHYVHIARDWVFPPAVDDAGYADGMVSHPYARPSLLTPVTPAVTAALMTRHAQTGGRAGQWLTEIGTSDDWFWKSHPESQRHLFTARSIAPMYVANRLGASADQPFKMFWWTARYGQGSEEGFNLWSKTNPRAGIAAYAAMTHFLEDTELLGDIYARAQAAWAVQFIDKQGGSVVVMWPETTWPDQPLQVADLLRSEWTLPRLDFEAFDFLGRRMPPPERNDLVLQMTTHQAVYLRSRRPPEQVRQAVLAARFGGLDPVRVNPQPLTLPLSARPPLRVRVTNRMPTEQQVRLVLRAPAEIELAETEQIVKELQPGESRLVSFPIVHATARPDNRYDVHFTAEAGGASVVGKTTVQVACSSHGTPTIDGDLSDWAEATFVSIRHPGPLSDWADIPPAMLQGEGYRLAMKWDERHLYFAAEIPDRTSRFDASEPQTTAEALQYRSRGNDSLHIGFNLLDNNPDDYLLGHPLDGKSLASDIDYEFSAELKKDKEDQVQTNLNRLLYPGSRYLTLPRPDLNPPLGKMNDDASRVRIRYDQQRQLYIYEFALPLDELPALRQRLAALRPGEATEANFGFMVVDGHKWQSPTRWCEELGDTELAAYGFSPRFGTPCWLAEYGTRMRNGWGFVRGP